MGVAHFLAERRDRPELGGVGGVEWREVLADAGSVILCWGERGRGAWRKKQNDQDWPTLQGHLIRLSLQVTYKFMEDRQRCLFNANRNQTAVSWSLSVRRAPSIQVKTHASKTLALGVVSLPSFPVPRLRLTWKLSLLLLGRSRCLSGRSERDRGGSVSARKITATNDLGYFASWPL